MPAGAEGATDVLSSLPIIACCIVAVMVLLAAIGQARSDGNPSLVEESLRGYCGELLEEAKDLLTELWDDGMAYLAGDWRERLADLPCPESSFEGASLSVIVRLLGEEAVECRLSGNISGCSQSCSDSAPVIRISGGIRIPGEIVAMVGI